MKLRVHSSLGLLGRSQALQRSCDPSFKLLALRCLEHENTHAKPNYGSVRTGFRNIHSTPNALTDGVFRGLEEGRMFIPWKEALRRQREESRPGHTSQTPETRDLTPRKMSDSFFKIVLPLAQDEWLGDTYLNVNGHIRLAAILMDLDALSGIISYKHTGEGVTTVTAAVDRISIENPLTEICDLEYSGQVTYATGRSSMELSCQVAKAPPEGQRPPPEDVLMTITFTMVSLDPFTKKPTHIPGLQPTNAEEEKLYKLGEKRSLEKKQRAAKSLLSSHPDEAESALIHRIWLAQVAAHDPSNESTIPSNVIPMSNTILRSAAIMQPQYRNRHSYVIFGGFLLKSSFELAFSCCANFAHARPTFISADPCTFLHPVPVGSVLYLSATVIYTDPPWIDAERISDSDTPKGKTRVSVRVDSKVRDVEHGLARPTGQFHYTFLVDRDVRVMPQSYQEHMLYIDGRRRSIQVQRDVPGRPSEEAAAWGQLSVTE